MLASTFFCELPIRASQVVTHSQTSTAVSMMPHGFRDGAQFALHVVWDEVGFGHEINNDTHTFSLSTCPTQETHIR